MSVATLFTGIGALGFVYATSMGLAAGATTALNEKDRVEGIKNFYKKKQEIDANPDLTRVMNYINGR